MSAITEIINSAAISPTPDRVDDLISIELAKVDGDWEQVARRLAYACLVLERHAEVAVTIPEQLMPSTPEQRGRPPGRVAAGLYVPVKFRTKRETIGAPKQNALPKSTKAHAIHAAEAMRLDPVNLSNARDAAIIELVEHGVRPTEKAYLF